MKLGSLNLRMPKKLWLSVALVTAAVALIGGIAFAASFALNQSVPAVVDVAGGGSPPPPPPPGSTPTSVFTSASLTEVVGALDFGAVTTAGGSPEVTVFVDTAKMLASTVVVTAPSLPAGYAISVPTTNDTTGALTVRLTVPAGQPIANDVVLGSISFVGSRTVP